VALVTHRKIFLSPFQLFYLFLGMCQRVQGDYETDCNKHDADWRVRRKPTYVPYREAQSSYKYATSYDYDSHDERFLSLRSIFRRAWVSIHGVGILPLFPAGNPGSQTTQQAAVDIQCSYARCQRRISLDFGGIEEEVYLGDVRCH
jgi:hypothetical protein